MAIFTNFLVTFQTNSSILFLSTINWEKLLQSKRPSSRRVRRNDHFAKFVAAVAADFSEGASVNRRKLTAAKLDWNCRCEILGKRASRNSARTTRIKFNKVGYVNLEKSGKFSALVFHIPLTQVWEYFGIIAGKWTKLSNYKTENWIFRIFEANNRLLTIVLQLYSLWHR